MRCLVVLSLCLAVAAPFAAVAEVILDDSFEDVGSPDWSASGSDPAYSWDFDSTADARTGSESLLVTWSVNVPQWNAMSADYFMPVAEGDPYDAEVYAKVDVAFPGTIAYLETIFRNDSGGEVGAHLQSAQLGDTTTDWTQLSNSGTVPVGATTSQYRLVTFTTGAAGSDQGTIYWDDAYAAVPEPLTCTLLGIGLGGVLLLRRKRTAK